MSKNNNNNIEHIEHTADVNSRFSSRQGCRARTEHLSGAHPKEPDPDGSDIIHNWDHGHTNDVKLGLVKNCLRTMRTFHFSSQLLTCMLQQ